MSKWSPIKTTDVVGFEVVGVEKAEYKPGYCVTSVLYPSQSNVYTYVRKMATGTALGEYPTVVDGCKVSFTIDNDDNCQVLGVERIYDTKGMRKKTNPGSGSRTKDGDVTNNIKQEMDDKKNEKPIVVNSQEGPVKHEKYQVIKNCLECDIPVYLSGPAGSGKNYTVEQIAKEMGWQFYFSNSVQQEYKLTGFIDAGGDFHETEFYKACASDDDCIFFLDEIDASIPEVLVLLNAAIANQYFEFPTGRVDLSNVHFVAAGNTVGSGADELYTGRMVIDQATLDRFAIIEFDYDINIEMAISNNNQDLVKFIRELREVSNVKCVRATFSYRCITMVTKLERTGMDIADILKIAVVKGLDDDTIGTLFVKGESKYHKGLSKLRRAA